MSVTLVVTSGAQARVAESAPTTLTFDQPRIVIGRGLHADVRLPSRAVSDTHAVVRMDVSELSITDEGSTNGTAVNGQVLVRGRKKSLRAGDKISVPGFELLVQDSHAASDPPERTAAVARRLLSAAIAAVGGETAPPELVLTSGRRAGQQWPFPPAPSRMVVGRGEMCEVALDDADCSRQHAEFHRDKDGVVVRDLGSKNGVTVGGRRLTERRLRDGDEIALGRSTLRFNDPAEQLLRAFEGGTDDAAPVLESMPVAAPEPVRVPEPEAAEGVGPAAPVVAAPGSSQGDAGSASAVIAPAVGGAGDGARAVRPGRGGGRAADWVVIVLAVLILGVSVAALYFVLKGAAPPR